MESGISRKHGPITVVTETFAYLTLKGVAFDNGSKHLNRIFNRRTWREKAVQSSAIIASSEVEGVFIGSFSDEPDFSQIRTRTTIRASRNTKTDGIVMQSVFIKHHFELFKNVRECALTFGEGEAASWQSYTREGIEAETGAVVLLV
jgi:hypothetical protein